MKTKILIFTILTLLGSFSCSNEDMREDSIPENIKSEVESFIDEKESSFEHKYEKFIGFDWNYSRIESPDSIIYPFAVIFERDGKNYPFRHRCVIKADTLTDILKFNYMFNDWVSLIPIPYNVREENWWIELENIESIVSLKFDRRLLELKDTTSNSWREVFIGNVELLTNDNILFADTLFWNPVLNEIKVPTWKLEQHRNGKTVISSGLELVGDPSLTKWKSSEITGQIEL